MKAALKLLPALLATGGLLAFTYHSDSLAKTAKRDNKIMARQKREVKLDLLGEGGGAGINDIALDSMMRDLHMALPEQMITATPDGKLKFYVITEDICGAYCHYHYVSFAHLATGKLLRGGHELRRIDSIYVLPDGKYLLIQSWGERAFSACSDNVQAATVLSVEGDSVILHPAIFKNADNTSDTSVIEFRTSFAYYPIPVYITYDRVAHTLSYQYGGACGYTDETAPMHTGSLQYSHGIFIQKKDSIWPPVIEDDKEDR